MTTITVASPQYLNLNISDGSSDVNLAVTLPSEITLAVDVGQGPSGPQGIQGNSITNIARTSGTGAAGTTDTYTIYYSDNTTDTFQLYNGQNGNYIYEGVPVVQQTDIGTEPNEIPLNQYLGSMAYQNKEAVSIDNLTVGIVSSLYSEDGLTTTLSLNRYLDGGTVKYKVTGASSSYEQYNGGHYWFSSASGSAGTSISNNQLMYLTSSGDVGLSTNSPSGPMIYSSESVPLRFGISGTEQMRLTSTGLGIGTSSPGARLTVSGGRAQFTGNTAPSSGSGLELFYDGTVAGSLAYARGTGYLPNAMDGSDLRFYTSSSERLRIDSSGNVGIGTSSPTPYGPSALGKGLHIAATQPVVRLNGTGTTAANYDIFVPANTNALAFFDAGAGVERLRIDSNGNVGIGTSSVTSGYKLEAQNGASGTGIRASNSGGGYIAIEAESNASSNGVLRWTNDIKFIEGVTERMRLSSGNLGLGVVPSAWGSYYKAIESTTASEFCITSQNNGIELGRGYYKVNAGFGSVYTTDQSPSKYAQGADGSHSWYTAPSGTAGNAISFTQALTLNADGKLLIGTTTAGASKLTVNDNSIQINTAKTPASATDTGTAGQVAWDANYVYVCVATNTWKRSALSTW